MGTREFTIALIFLGLGAAAYWMTARPAPTASPSGLDHVLDTIRREAAPETVTRATHTTTGEIPVSAAADTLAISGFSHIDVVGEPRDDIAWHLASTATEAGGSSGSAESLAVDDQGGVLAVSRAVADDGRGAGRGRRGRRSLSLKVPSRLTLAVDGADGVTARGLAAVELANVSGEVTVEHITGPVRGSLRNGRLAVRSVGDVRLSLVNTQATLSAISGDVDLSCRNGTCTIERAQGVARVDANESHVTFRDLGGALHLRAFNGRVDIDGARAPVRVHGRDAAITVTLTHAVATTVVAVDGLVTLGLASALPITLDASVTDGRLDASTFGLAPTLDGTAARLHHVWGDAARVVVRSTDGEIVIARRY